MLNLVKVENISFDELRDNSFDIGIFASGYESRCIFLAQNIDSLKIKYKLVLGFFEHSDDETRKNNDEFYEKEYSKILVISSQEEKKIYSHLISLFAMMKEQSEIRILIDYTSMSRLWYSGILNFIRLQSKKEIVIFLNYSLGQYDESFLDNSYTSINSIPFHEGTLSSNTKTLLVLAVGFTPYVIRSVIEEIEPNQTIGILPISIDNKHEMFSSEIKTDILVKDIDEWINCPINDLESIFSTYAYITNTNLSSRDILFLSLGPKIFTVASLLVSQRFHQVTCLYLKSSGSKKNDVKPTGDLICNKITYCL